MKTTQNYKDEIAELQATFPDYTIEKDLQSTLNKIQFLESIYMTGGANHRFSEKFNAAAVSERTALCLRSSACYELLREREEIKNEA